MKITDRLHISIPGILGGLTALLGALSHPEVLALLPAKAATAVTVSGILIASVTKPVVHSAE